MRPPLGLIAACQWLLKHPLGWLVIDLLGWVAFGTALVSLTLVDRWNLPMPLHNTVLAVLTVGCLGPMVALLFTWLDQRNAERLRAWGWWLNESAAGHHAKTVWGVRQIWPTIQLPVLPPPEQLVPAARRGGDDDTVGLNTDAMEAEHRGYMRGLADGMLDDEEGEDDR